jgi:hypothetical protein
VVVTLSSNDPTVEVPASVTVSRGAETADFPVSTRPVSRDLQVVITGSVPGRSVVATQSVWAVLPTFFSFVSEPGEVIGRGGFGRFTVDNASFTAICQASQIYVLVLGTNSEVWSVRLAAPKGTPLRVGSYENAAFISPSPYFPSNDGPEIGISGNGAGCTAAGRFTVHEVEVTANGDVRRFWATFEQRCTGRTQMLSGDIRVTNPRNFNAGTSGCTVR